MDKLVIAATFYDIEKLYRQRGLGERLCLLWISRIPFEDAYDLWGKVKMT